MLDGGPSRTSQGLDRRAQRRPEQIRRAPEEPQPVESPVPTHRSPASQPKTDKPGFIKRFLKPLIVVIIVLAVIAAGWMVWQNSRGFGSTIDSSKYQAVFLSGGEVYFGKLKVSSSDSLVLSEVYYLKASSDEGGTDNPQDSSSEAQDSNIQLIKLGNEIHGPEDVMEISREQVLYFENLKSDSQVTELMKENKD